MPGQDYNQMLSPAPRLLPPVGEAKPNSDKQPGPNNTPAAAEHNDKCGTCESVVTDKDKAVVCEVCDRLYHIVRCDNLPENVWVQGEL